MPQPTSEAGWLIATARHEAKQLLLKRKHSVSKAESGRRGVLGPDFDGDELAFTSFFIQSTLVLALVYTHPVLFLLSTPTLISVPVSFPFLPCHQMPPQVHYSGSVPLVGNILLLLWELRLYSVPPFRVRVSIIADALTFA